MNTPKAMLYAHQVGSMCRSLPRNCRNTQLAGMVRKDPPLICAVKLSASRRSGKIAQSEYRPIVSIRLGLVVRRMPKRRERTRLIMARAMPVRTSNRKKSIRKNSTAPPIVVSLSATK